MNQENKDILEQDIEFEYTTKRLLGEQISMDTFLDGYTLTRDERRHLELRLRRWEQSMDGFQEYYNSKDSKALIDKILEQISATSQNPRIFDVAWIVVRVAERALESGTRFLYSIVPVAPQLRAETITGTVSTKGISEKGVQDREELLEEPTSFLWSGPILNGMRLEQTPKPRILVDLNKDIEAGFRIRFFDPDGNEVYPNVAHPLDVYGIASFDFSNMPPGKYLARIETPSEPDL